MEVFYDGLNVEKYVNSSFVTGFTTNSTLFSTSKFSSYESFFNEHKHCFTSKPVSFQIWEDEVEQAIAQVEAINSLGTSIYVKIPILNSLGGDNSEVISYAVSRGMQVNLTAIYTMDQICLAANLLRSATAPAIISIFAGSISDVFVDPAQHILYAKQLFRDKPNCRLLWAGCRELYAVERARMLGCHIITIPDGVIEKYEIQYKSLYLLSKERAQKFRNDALSAKLCILSSAT